MSQINAIILLIFIALIGAGGYTLAQNSQQTIAQQNTNKNAPAAQAVNDSQSSRHNSNRHNYKPKDGYVRDEETAISIAVAVWKPIYGKEHIEDEKPYRAKLKNGVWTVTGSLPEGWNGGVAEAEIAKDDGRILRITHGQ